MHPKRALIFANGQIIDDAAASALLRPGDLWIAADGGARHLTRLGHTPHVVIGDMDSLTVDELAQLQASGARIERYPAEKDATDLELALVYALDAGCTILRVVGGLGNRIDQTLANIALLGLPELVNCDARLDDGREEVFLIRSRATLRGATRDTVSLIPFGSPAEGVTTRGLRYPLNAETLLPERSRGVSNEMLANEAVITLEKGTLICIHTRQEGTNDEEA